MRGAIIGDIIGSAFVDIPQSTLDFQLLKPFSAYTDDTVLTLATADAIINKQPYEQSIRDWVKRFPKAGYKPSFLDWAMSNKDHNEYDCKGDGAARRVSPIGFAATSIEEAMFEAHRSSCITHTLETKIRAAQALAGAIFLANNGSSKEQIKSFLEQKFGYDLSGGLNKDQANLMCEQFNSPAPAAFMAFLDSSDYEDSIRKSIWLGGPVNTIACISGGISQAYYKHIPKSLTRKTLSRFSLDMETLIEQFEDRFNIVDKNYMAEVAPLDFR